MNEARLIDANALKENLRQYFTKGEALYQILTIIDNAPTVEAFTKEDMAGAYNEGYACGGRESKRPQGEWARHDEWVGGEYVGGFYHIDCPCIDLETAYYSRWRTNFCPNCGAKMQKGGAE